MSRRQSRRMLATRPSDPPSERTFEQALQQLEATALRPGQTMINRARVMEIVRTWDPLLARSAVARSGTRRILVEGHHTTIAACMVGAFGPRMGAPAAFMPMVSSCSWLPSRRGGRIPMAIVDEPTLPRPPRPRATPGL